MKIWLVVGFGGQIFFFLRFLIQWIASEKKGKSVIPVYFWYFSLIGGLTLLIYAIHIKDPVFIAGQGMGSFIYIRNLMLIYKNKRAVPEE